MLKKILGLIALLGILPLHASNVELDGEVKTKLPQKVEYWDWQKDTHFGFSAALTYDVANTPFSFGGKFGDYGVLGTFPFDLRVYSEAGFGHSQIMPVQNLRDSNVWAAFKTEKVNVKAKLSFAGGDVCDIKDGIVQPVKHWVRVDLKDLNLSARYLGEAKSVKFGYELITNLFVGPREAHLRKNDPCVMTLKTFVMHDFWKFKSTRAELETQHKLYTIGSGYRGFQYVKGTISSIFEITPKWLLGGEVGMFYPVKDAEPQKASGSAAHSLGTCTCGMHHDDGGSSSGAVTLGDEFLPYEGFRGERAGFEGNRDKKFTFGGTGMYYFAANYALSAKCTALKFHNIRGKIKLYHGTFFDDASGKHNTDLTLLLQAQDEWKVDRFFTVAFDTEALFDWYTNNFAARSTKEIKSRLSLSYAFRPTYNFTLTPKARVTAQYRLHKKEQLYYVTPGLEAVWFIGRHVKLTSALESSSKFSVSPTSLGKDSYVETDLMCKAAAVFTW